MQKVRIFHDGQSSEKAHYRYRNAARKVQISLDRGDTASMLEINIEVPTE